MTAAEITENTLKNILHDIKVHCRVTKVTQNDWVDLPVAGIRPATLIGQFLTGAAETFTFRTLTVNNTGDAYDTSSLAIVYDGATANDRPSGGYYVLTASGEILFVTADSGYDSTGGTLTVMRACLGTTASATGLADGNTLYVLCSVTLTSSTTGVLDLEFSQLQNDPKADLY